MFRQIDHCVIVLPDLARAMDNARAAGFAVEYGGRHREGVTENALIAFADGAYIELIAPTGEHPDEGHRWFPRLNQGGGLVDLCLLSDDLDAEVERLQAAGLPYSPVRDQGRNRADGVPIDWRLSVPDGPVGTSGLPFLIEDVTARNLRVADDEPRTTHANGARGLAGVTILVNDLDGERARWRSLLGTEPRPLSLSDEDNPSAYIFPVAPHGHQWIMLSVAGSQSASDYLSSAGQGPFRITLAGATDQLAPGESTSIDPHLMGGARIQIG